MLLTSLDIKFQCKELCENKGSGIIAKHFFYFKGVFIYDALKQTRDFIAGYRVLKQISESQAIALSCMLIKYSMLGYDSSSYKNRFIIAKDSFFVDTILQLKNGIPLLFIYNEQDSEIVPVNTSVLESVVWLSNNEALLLIAKEDGRFNLYYSNSSVYGLNTGPKPCLLKSVFESV